MAARRVGHFAPENGRGFSLIETLITALVVTITAAGLFQFTGHVLLCHQINQAESKDVLGLWNQARGLRRSRPDSQDTIAPVPGARPVHRFILKNRYGREWEVLCAEK